MSQKYVCNLIIIKLFFSFIPLCLSVWPESNTANMVKYRKTSYRRQERQSKEKKMLKSIYWFVNYQLILCVAQ